MRSRLRSNYSIRDKNPLLERERKKVKNKITDVFILAYFVSDNKFIRECEIWKEHEELARALSLGSVCFVLSVVCVKATTTPKL